MAKLEKMLEKPATEINELRKDTADYGMMIPEDEETEGPRLYHFVASKQIRDRDNDLIYCNPNEKGSGIGTEDYEKNPVFLAFHNDRQFPVGKCVKYAHTTGKDGIPQFEIWVEFAKTEEGQKAEYLYANGFMNAVSIRFRPTEYIYDDNEKGYNVFGCKLYEVSAVPLPANQEALLIKAMKTEQENIELKKKLEKKEIAIEEKLLIIQKNLVGEPDIGIEDKTKATLDAIYRNLTKE